MRLDGYDFAISDKDEALRYQDLLDVLTSGEPPPNDEPQPAKAVVEAAIGELTTGLFEARKRLASTGGSVTMRRLNRREYAATILLSSKKPMDIVARRAGKLQERHSTRFPEVED